MNESFLIDLITVKCLDICACKAKIPSHVDLRNYIYMYRPTSEILGYRPFAPIITQR